ncbi:MAG: hypothetical protein KGV50_00335 [Gammaproteobacteria bacterium]|nr:hypothetical protein [Gammaproteobacteria bacterium]
MYDEHQNHYQQLTQLNETANKQEMEWIKHMMTIASGGFALLVALLPQNEHSQMSGYMLAGAWISLGLGLVFGVVSLRIPHTISKRRVQAYKDRLLDSIENDTVVDLSGVVTTPLLLRLCRFLVPFSFLTAVVCLVVYAVGETLV